MSVEDQIQDNKLHILGKLTASLIHEIRNPLSVINLNLDYIKMCKGEFSSELLECVEACADSTLRIQSLIDNMLDFSRKNNSTESVASVNHVTARTISIMEAFARKQNTRIIVELNPNLKRIKFQELKLLQVFLNLTTNSIDACSAGGEIVIRSYMKTENELEAVIWEIIDNGAGIENAIKDEIFNDFFTHKQTGTGLGLSICKMLLNEFDAAIHFESEAGKGSKFVLQFHTV